MTAPRIVSLLPLALTVAACASDDPGASNSISLGTGDGSSTGQPGDGQSTPFPSGTDDDTIVLPPEDEPEPVISIIEALPPGFTATTGGGGYRRVGTLAELGDPNGDECANVLRGIARDFEHSHPDFGAPKQPGEAKGMVGPIGAGIGPDRKPVRDPLVYDNVAVQMGDWYNNVDGINVPYVVDIWLEPQGSTFVFDSSRFYPLEGVGTISGDDDDGTPRNFGFTTELHTAFEYKGGETFSFRGDDDVFVYIDGKLVLDMGGIHNPENGMISVDTLGLTPGQVYSLDLFHAERNPTGSNFRIETTLDFSECGEILTQDLIK